MGVGMSKSRPNLKENASFGLTVEDKLTCCTGNQVRIDDVWYDLSRWRKAHPAGSHWIDLYRDQVPPPPSFSPTIYLARSLSLSQSISARQSALPQ